MYIRILSECVERRESNQVANKRASILKMVRASHMCELYNMWALEKPGIRSQGE